jgi:accessory gene regulator B
MRFIKTWSFACANYLTKQLNENHEKRGIYYYGFQIVIGSVVKGIILILVSLLLGALIPTLLLTAVFVSLRVLAGGYHMDSYGKCAITSIGLFVVFGTMIQYTYEIWPSPIILATLAAVAIYAFYSAYRWAPKDTPNKPITKPEQIKKLRILTFTHLIIWLPLTYTLIYFEIKMIALCLIFGILISIFIITPEGHRFFDMIKGKMKTI